MTIINPVRPSEQPYPIRPYFVKKILPVRLKLKLTYWVTFMWPHPSSTTVMSPQQEASGLNRSPRGQKIRAQWGYQSRTWEFEPPLVVQGWFKLPYNIRVFEPPLYDFGSPTVLVFSGPQGIDSAPLIISHPIFYTGLYYYYRYKNKPVEIYLGTTRVPHGMGTPAGIPEGHRGQNPPGSRWVSRVGPTWCPVRDPLGSLTVVFAG